MQRNCKVPRVEMPLLYQAVEDLMITPPWCHWMSCLATKIDPFFRHFSSSVTLPGSRWRLLNRFNSWECSNSTIRLSPQESEGGEFSPLKTNIVLFKKGWLEDEICLETWALFWGDMLILGVDLMLKFNDISMLVPPKKTAPPHDFFVGVNRVPYLHLR